VTATGFGTPSTSDNRRMFTQALLEAAESPESAHHKDEVGERSIMTSHTFFEASSIMKKQGPFINCQLRL
jgi:hypothetical protein